MKAKDKAKELHRKFYLLNGESDSWDIAKQCTLMAVDEIIKVLSQADTCYNLIEHIDYWNEVKHEIELL